MESDPVLGTKKKKKEKKTSWRTAAVFGSGLSRAEPHFPSTQPLEPVLCTNKQNPALLEQGKCLVFQPGVGAEGRLWSASMASN